MYPLDFTEKNCHEICSHCKAGSVSQLSIFSLKKAEGEFKLNFTCLAKNIITVYKGSLAAFDVSYLSHICKLLPD